MRSLISICRTLKIWRTIIFDQLLLIILLILIHNLWHTYLLRLSLKLISYLDVCLSNEVNFLNFQLPLWFLDRSLWLKFILLSKSLYFIIGKKSGVSCSAILKLLQFLIVLLLILRLRVGSFVLILLPIYKPRITFIMILGFFTKWISPFSQIIFRWSYISILLSVMTFHILVRLRYIRFFIVFLTKCFQSTLWNEIRLLFLFLIGESIRPWLTVIPKSTLFNIFILMNYTWLFNYLLMLLKEITWAEDHIVLLQQFQSLLLISQQTI